jgi:hypothetical protein
METTAKNKGGNHFVVCLLGKSDFEGIIGECLWALIERGGMEAASRDGNDSSILVLDDDEVSRDDLVRVHEHDGGLVERVGADAATFHEGAVWWEEE